MATTELLNVNETEGYWSRIQQAAEVIRQGGVVAFPTETVYGLAVSSENGDAVAKLRAAKGRDDGVPLTVHVGRPQDGEAFINAPSGTARRLMRRGWPGPLTIIFDVPNVAQTAIAERVEQGTLQRIFHKNTVGIRCPDHPAACDLIRESGCVIQATSANLTGAPPAVTVEQVQSALDGKVDLILDGGRCRYANASTIVRLNGRSVDILREGVLDEGAMGRMMRATILVVCTGNTCRSPMAEGLLKHKLADHIGCSVDELDRHGFEVRSAGTFAGEGAPATPEAVRAMADRGIDISDHQSSPVHPEVLESAAIVLAMTRSHQQQLEAVMPDSSSRCHLVCGDEDVPDPIGGTSEVYSACLEQIAQGLDQQLRENIL
jgi:protein-tyrosine phosphatase